MKEPIRIVSDLHLGHRISRIARVETLRPLLAGAGTVIFNGDTWQELSRELRADAAEKLEKLRALCREEGCEAVFLAGNHDPGWAGKGYVEVAGGKVVVMHGDALLADGSPWKREILTGRARVEAIWARHPSAETVVDERLAVAREIAAELPSWSYSSGRKIWQRALDAVMPPQRGIEMVRAWWTQAAAGGRFCERYFPAAEFLLIGHFHRGGSWLVNGRRVINTGSFLDPGRARWAEIEDGWLSFGIVEETRERCAKGGVSARWRI